MYRDVDLNFLKVPADASKKMDDKVMDLLEPYDYSQLRDFNTPYLSGYLAEKYNYTDEEMFPRVQKRAADDTMSYIKSTLREYSSVKYKNQKISIWPKDVHYALLPVWMLCFDYENTERNFIMNGQTGKIIGKPPISKGKVVKWYFIFALIIYVILMLTNVT